jgi:alpha-maltose-1-phosphate synthase
VGIVARVKRWHVAARAAREAGWRLEVVGPIAEPDAAAEIRAALPDVALRGEVPDEEVQAALHRATVLVHPSSAEAMPFAVLEGMATGLPVLGGEALRDVVEDGVEGRLVPEPAGSRGEAALAGAYASVLRATPPDAWAAMGERARRRVVERNSWDAVAAATCEVYRLVRERTS